MSINLYYYHFILSTVARRFYISVPEITNPINALKFRIFKNGLTIEKNPMLASEVYSDSLKMDAEDKIEEYNTLRDFVSNCNGFERTLEEELKSFYDGLNIYDCGYVLSKPRL